ncbi:TolC family outer membrane protein [Sphingomicrobium astaxanthinifaciens]|uniref:TolC family outer membrane protein n=1 Tax=Sphingomicrobium astaxanthinifaciens TaxID=1227949 RepID=UPI001FCBE62A|nr:TolC family outer membrane protein [Sphingomicrobium astaxanthinifaciens]MCJ7420662.1 TolC family outer membrane protein [Sphingomicrobium astaxanthinifaciens]
MRVGFLAFGAALVAIACPAAASAQDRESLSEALVDAYRTNPTLTAQREALRGTDAGVALARAGSRPTLSAIAGLDRELSRRGALGSQAQDFNLSVGADLSLPLFQGGRVKNDIRAAKARVEAGRATLRAVEGDVFTQAVAAYMDVIRARAVVDLSANQVEVLTTNLEATEDRFEIGDLTRTDVAQSQARLQLAQSRLAGAVGQLAAAEEIYRQVIGDDPGELAPPPPLPPLPETPEQAVRIALVDNADLEAARELAQAAGFDVRVARAARLPTLSAVGSGTYVNALGNAGEDVFGSPFPNDGSVTSVGLTSRIPLYQGGAPAARVAQAQAFAAQRLELLVAAERAVIAEARSAFAAYEAAQRAIEANQVAVEANELALEGARLENSIGTRSVLFVLDAEQELLNARVDLVTAERDAYVAGFRLLNAMGQAEADDLQLDGGALYDPVGAYREVAGRWTDWGDRDLDGPVATSTATPEERPQSVTERQ